MIKFNRKTGLPLIQNPRILRKKSKTNASLKTIKIVMAVGKNKSINKIFSLLNLEVLEI